MEMTIPVPKKFEQVGGGTKVTMSFFLTMDNPPAPTDSDVTLTTIAQGTVFYVRYILRTAPFFIKKNKKEGKKRKKRRKKITNC